MVRGRQIEFGHMAFASLHEWQGPLSPVAAILRGEHLDRAGTFDDRLEGCGKSAGLGLWVERRAAVRNDDQLHVGLLAY